VSKENGNGGAPCEHMQVTAAFQIQRVGARGESLLDLVVKCADCGEPFVFTLGQPAPTKLRLAIAPASLSGQVTPMKRIVVPSIVGVDN
jgi:hypothetical protein